MRRQMIADDTGNTKATDPFRYIDFARLRSKASASTERFWPTTNRQPNAALHIHDTEKIVCLRASSPCC
jgi:hypothetical protein